MSRGGTPVARGSIAAAAAVHALLLSIGSAGYGYHRDELYFRMLPPRWSYLDQPPLTPFLARLTTHLADEPWALRIPATLASTLAVVLLALLTHRLGGGIAAQRLAAWGYAVAAFPLMLGHLLLTSTIDLPILLGVVLMVVKAVDGQPKSWLAAGVLAGAAAYNRLLVVALLASLVAGLLALGPRATLRMPWPWLGALAALVVAAPQIAYQAGHDWPQLRMGQALSENNASEVRILILPMLLVMLGPPLVWIWVRGFRWLLDRERRHRFGFLAVGFGAFLIFALATGAQPHYPVHLLSVLYAAGCVPVGARLGAGLGGWRWAILANGLVSVVLALPVVPATRLGATPLPQISQLVGDQVGWERYVEQVATAYRRAGDADILTSNYGEAGAVARFGPAYGLPAPVSGHNALADLTMPTRDRVLVVGGAWRDLAPAFARCERVGELDNGVDVDNEEQGEELTLCTGRTRPWADLWPHLAHLD